MERNSTNKIKKLTVLGMFAALAYVIHYVHIPVGFLNLDFKDVIMAIAGLYFGPISGILLAFLVPLLELITVGETGIYGFIMNVLSSMSFVGIASLIYRFKKNFFGAIIALSCGAVAMVAVMMIANLCITPYYMHADIETVAKMIPTVLLPFNAVKAILNASLTLCLYKPLTRVIKMLGLGKVEKAGEVRIQSSAAQAVITYTVAASVAIISLVIIIVVMGGTIAFN